MAAKRRTLWLALAVVIALVVAAVVWTSGRTAAPAVQARAVSPRSPGSPGPAENDQAPAHVNLEALKADRGEPGDGGRNPFRFEARPQPAPTTEATPAARGNQAPVAPDAPPMPAGPPPPPDIPLKFIGVMTQGGARIAVLTDGKSTPQGGKEGDIILGQYRILKIGNESIEMAYLDGRGRKTIRLTGQ